MVKKLIITLLILNVLLWSAVLFVDLSNPLIIKETVCHIPKDLGGFWTC